MIAYYQIRSTLSQVDDSSINGFLDPLAASLGEELEPVSLERYLEEDFALLYVASGGSEGFFLDIFEKLKDRHCYILTSGETNSLAASMEILSFLNKNGGSGEIIHGDVRYLTRKIRSLANSHRALASLKGKRIGSIGAPSDWLIASSYSPELLEKKLGLGFVSISMDELFAEYEKKEYAENEYTRLFKSKDFDRQELEKALWVYGAVKRLCDKYGLCGVSLRCFDLLDSIHSTGCLALAILNAEGICGGCEGDVPALISMAILGAVTGEPMFLCNANRFDSASGEALFAHCTIPTTMLRDFCLNTHFESGIGVAVQGTFDESDCTIFKCEGDLSRFFVQEGRLESVPFSEMLCRTQVKLHLDDFSYFLTRPINNHHIVCKGHHAEAVEAFFQLIQA